MPVRKPGSIIEIDATTARRVALAAQGLAPHQLVAGQSVTEILHKLGCIQIDAITAVRRSQEIVLLSRGVNADKVGSELYESKTGFFETWGHAHSMLPTNMWPLLHWRRKQIRESGLTGPRPDSRVVNEVLREIELNGPQTHNALGTTRGSGWQRTSAAKIACEWLLSTGDLVVVSRDKKWRRIYSTPAQAGIQSEEALDVDESMWKTLEIAASALGIMTRRDLQDYFRFPANSPVLVEYLHGELMPVAVKGIPGDYYLFPGALEEVEKSTWVSPRLSVISPFDSLVWYRARQRALFGKDYRLEIYKPQARREFGYYAMPIICADRLIGRVAARVVNSSLRIENFEVDQDFSRDIVLQGVTKVIESWLT